MPNFRIPSFDRRVLLVESDADLAAFLTAVLRRAGIDLRLAANAEQAASLTASLRPEIVVSNATLADTSAWLMIEKLGRRTKRVDVWLYAASPTRRDSAWATFAGVEHVFYHGGAPWTLFTTLLELLVFSHLSGSRNDALRFTEKPEKTKSADNIPFSTVRSRS